MLSALCAALAGCERLVLLGDVVELRQSPLGAALSVAEPVLREIGQALPAGAEVVLVPGNHDHHLLGDWLERAARDGGPPELSLQTEVPWSAGDVLACLAAWLEPAPLSVSYPGVWLREDVYAIHGHYLDRHTTVPTFERLGAGAMARIVSEPAGGPRRVADYETVLQPIYAWLYAVAQRGGVRAGSGSAGAWSALARGPSRGGPRRGVGPGRVRRIRRRALMAGFPALIASLNRAGLGPLRAELSGSELRRGALRAIGEVLGRLQVHADHVIFGHTHRAGPLPRDEPSGWRTASGTRLINSGCWVHEPGFLGSDPGRSPYRAGFAVALDASGPPRLVNLLDSVTPPPRPG